MTPVCPDCDEEMIKCSVETVWFGWWVMWFCGCRLSKEEIDKNKKENEELIRKHHKGIPNKV